MKYFEFRETSNNKYTIVPIYVNFGEPSIKGSFGLFAARFLGMDYVTYLHYCEAWGATIRGKNSYYLVEEWDTPNKDFLDLLNQRASNIASKINVKELSF